MSKRISTNKTGVFYRVGADKTRTYYYAFKARNGKKVEKKVGSTANGFTVLMAVEARSSAIRLDTLGDDSKFTESKKTYSLDDVAAEYFVAKKKNRNNRKEMMRYRNHIGFLKQFHDDEVKQLQEKIDVSSGGVKTRHQTDLNKLMLKDGLSFLGSKPITAVTAPDITALMEKAENNLLGAKSRDSILSLLSAILDYGIKKRYVQFNEVRAWRSEDENENPKEDVDNVSERYLSTGEIEALYEAIEDSTDDVRYFVHLALKTGARASAICKIKKKDIKGNVITLSDEKRKKMKDRRYQIPLHSGLKTILESRLAEMQPNDTIISGDYASINKQTSKIYNRLFNDGLDFKEDRKEYMSNHGLRHTFASQLALAETSIYKIMKLMHHADIKMTERYAKLNPKENGFSELENLI
ncbi:MAG: tyrosine-type recombinase/integrase [Candidatus Thorarchaeota archaeon]